MSKHKLLIKLQKLFDAEARKKYVRKCEIRNILKRLKEKERKLAEKLEKTDEPEKSDLLRQELSIIYTQRKKGIKMLAKMKEATGGRENAPH